MRGIARENDIYGPGAIITSPQSPNVRINGRPVALYGIIYTPHACCGAKGCPPSHCHGEVFESYKGLRVNNQIPVLIHSVGTCGHRIETASQDVKLG